jgi:hypothetical protein
VRAEIAQTEAQIQFLQRELATINDRRQKLLLGSQSHSAWLKFNQDLALKMIEQSRLRVLNLELDTLKDRALLQLVEENLKAAKKPDPEK